MENLKLHKINVNLKRQQKIHGFLQKLYFKKLSIFYKKNIYIQQNVCYWKYLKFK